MGHLWLAKGLISLLRLPQLTSLERQRPWRLSVFVIHQAAHCVWELRLLCCLECWWEEDQGLAEVKFRFEKTLRTHFSGFLLKCSTRLEWTLQSSETSSVLSSKSFAFLISDRDVETLKVIFLEKVFQRVIPIRYIP